ncbi:MAG: hypothetical protein Q9174_006269 [Haloplaca sp. 1 TL-2023]
MQKYITLMTTYGKEAGIDFDFHGTVANTLDAHRMIQHYQEDLGPDVADKMVNSLYTQYFTRRAHPSERDTLLKAAKAAGVNETDAAAFLDDEYEGLQETKMLLREQAGNGVDSVPYITFEGRRRDFTLVGAKETAETANALAVNHDHDTQAPTSRGPTVQAESNHYGSEMAMSKRAAKGIGALGEGWVGHIIPSDAIYPADVGLKILGKFYNRVMASASSVWTAQQPKNFYLITYGSISLWIWAEDTLNPLNGISWSFVHDLASRLLDACNRGFAGLLDATFIHLATNAMIHVKLTIQGKR